MNAQELQKMTKSDVARLFFKRFFYASGYGVTKAQMIEALTTGKY